jgi:Fic family protein
VYLILLLCIYNKLNVILKEIMQYGSYKIIKFNDEEVRAYIPLNLEAALQYVNIDSNRISRVSHVLGKLDAICDILSESNLFIYLYVRKEALLSSQIEATQSLLIDVFSYENYKFSSTPIYDVEEVTNYIKALNKGLSILDNNELPLCNRLLRNLHEVLMQGVRGESKSPGEFRKSQNWIGGTRPGNAIFVPPPPEYVDELMGNLEKFIHEKTNISSLIKIALLHAQFETIHPFLDGNGRLGRLFITLLLHEYKIIKAPILYLSYYLKSKQSEYYRCLQNFRKDQDGVIEWINFFLDALEYSANDAFIKAIKLEKLIKTDIAHLKAKGSLYKVAANIFSVMKNQPIVSMPDLAQKLGVTLHTNIRAMRQLENLGLVQEITDKKSNRLYSYKKYIHLLSE